MGEENENIQRSDKGDNGEGYWCKKITWATDTLEPLLEGDFALDSPKFSVDKHIITYFSPEYTRGRRLKL